MLSVENVSVEYSSGGNVLQDVSIRINSSEIAALIGANGAGKTSLLMAISGVLKKKRGEIRFHEKIITHLRPHEIARLGVGHVPEGRKLFPEMTVNENLLLGAYSKKNKKQIQSMLNELFEVFPILSRRIKQRAGTLSGGEQQMLAIGRALMSVPSALLIDEPTSGLSPLMVHELTVFISNMKGRGLGVLLAEQNAVVALSIADYGYAMSLGSIVLEGKTEDLLANEKVKQIYLGG